MKLLEKGFPTGQIAKQLEITNEEVNEIQKKFFFKSRSSK
jgi:hypothetical protein